MLDYTPCMQMNAKNVRLFKKVLKCFYFIILPNLYESHDGAADHFYLKRFSDKTRRKMVLKFKSVINLHINNEFWLNLLTPLWILLCLVKLVFREKVLWHSLHANGRIPECTKVCFLRSKIK